MMPPTSRIDRRAQTPVSPEYEDSGLFKGGVIQVQLALVPVFGTTSRGDCTTRGFNADGCEVSVVFAGRRRPHFEAIYNQLRYMYAQAHHMDAIRGVKMRDVNDIQLQVQCEGAWRARMLVDENGQERRSLQFMLARWAFQAHDGQTLRFGTAPLIAQRPKAAPKDQGETAGFGAGTWPPTRGPGAAFSR
ncbi:hypothetical protein [Epibacterium sp. Ofav1-8]|jgi:hypothetical protein|uniref:hypothetical protein n=1 Tax=Epibacterium sp. Ofav1-8 TaxID=2917735 RepID=UPI001EF4BF7C|nr:hypothetical protein [Epibacterium sp. Ofav1-8]MCG7624025.1 hypothetical protein [Epibacterium sp. Ofav1-8]